MSLVPLNILLLLFTIVLVIVVGVTFRGLYTTNISISAIIAINKMTTIGKSTYNMMFGSAVGFSVDEVSIRVVMVVILVVVGVVVVVVVEVSVGVVFLLVVAGLCKNQSN